MWLLTLINFHFTAMTTFYKYTFAVFPNVAFSLAVKFMNQYERSSRPLSMWNMHVSLFTQEDDQEGAVGVYTLSSLLLVMCMWSAMYLVVSWYLERIMPGEYGVKLPFYFPFMVRSLFLRLF